MSLNKVMLIGNVGKDPEVNQLNTGKVASFPLATSEKYTRRDGCKVENTDWHNVVFFGKAADIVESYVKKGVMVYVEGKLRQRSYDDANGTKRYVTEVVSDNIQFLSKIERAKGGQQAPHADTEYNDNPDADLPF